MGHAIRARSRLDHAPQCFRPLPRPHSPRSGAYSRRRKPTDCRPNMRLEPQDGGDTPFPTPGPDALRGLWPSARAGVPRLPIGALSGRLLPEPDSTPLQHRGHRTLATHEARPTLTGPMGLCQSTGSIPAHHRPPTSAGRRVPGRAGKHRRTCPARFRRRCGLRT